MSLAYFNSLLLLAKHDGSQIPVISARYARSPEDKNIPSFRHPAAARAGGQREPFRSIALHEESFRNISKDGQSSLLDLQNKQKV